MTRNPKGTGPLTEPDSRPPREELEQRLLRSEGLLRALSENFPRSFLSVINPDLTIGFTSGEEFKRRQMDPEDYVGRPVTDVFSEFGDAVVDTVTSAYRRAFSGEEQAFELALGGVYLAFQVVPLTNETGEVLQILAVVENITERKLTEVALRDSEALHRSVIAGMVEGVVVQEASGTITFANAAAEQILGLSSDDLRDRSSSGPRWKTIHEDGSPFPGETHPAVVTLKTGEPQRDVIMGIPRTDGSLAWISINSQPLSEPGETQPHAAVATFHDVTESKLAEQQLFDEKERAQVTLQSIGDAVITTDAEGLVDYLNPVAESLTGWPRSEAQGQSLSQVFPIIDEYSGEPVVDPVARCLAEGEIIDLSHHTLLCSRDGAQYSIQDSAAPIRDREGNIQGVVLVFSDVTEQRRITAQMEYQASHDELTGLTNRTELERRLERVIMTSRSDDSRHVLCYLDLDQFKVVNDTCGHAAGDELLRQLASLLKNKTRKRDTLARLGGDEFGLLLEHCELAQAEMVAETLRSAIEDFLFVWESDSFRISSSIGLVPIDATSGSRATVLQAADSACYVAKDAGRNRVHVYTDDDAELTRRHGELLWVNNLQEALERDRFELFAQRIVPLSQDEGEKKLHCELLLRLIDSAGERISPALFTSAAERYNLAPRIDRWVVRHAFQFFDEHSDVLPSLELCTINLSGASLSDSGFLRFVMSQLEDTKLPPERFCFEITETAAITNLTSARQVIKTLKGHGCAFALDDFGSGLSSFGYLKSLPVDYLKIDGLFVQDIADDPVDLAMVRSINEIGQLMGKKTIAEHVENDTILERLRTLNVDYAQGYAIARPQPLEELLLER